MAQPQAIEVNLSCMESSEEEYQERVFQVNPGAKAFLAKDDPEAIAGVGIGRASRTLGNNDFYKAGSDNAWIECPTISRRHAVLTVDHEPPFLTIMNVAATHGLFVNDNKIEPQQHHRLRQGDIIQLSTEVRRDEGTLAPRKFKVFFGPVAESNSFKDDTEIHGKTFAAPEDSDDADDASDLESETSSDNMKVADRDRVSDTPSSASSDENPSEGEEDDLNAAASLLEVLEELDPSEEENDLYGDDEERRSLQNFESMDAYLHTHDVPTIIEEPCADDSDRRMKIAQMLSEVHKTITPQPSTAAYTPQDTQSCVVDQPCESHIAPSMSLNRILDAPTMSATSFHAPANIISYQNLTSNGSEWASPFVRGMTDSSNHTADFAPNVRATDIQSSNKYQDGPFTSQSDVDSTDATNGSVAETYQTAADPATRKKPGISIDDLVEKSRNDEIDNSPPASSSKRKAPFAEADATMISGPVITSKSETTSLAAFPEGITTGEFSSTRPLKKLRLTNPILSAPGSSSSRREVSRDNRERFHSFKNTLATATIGAVFGGITVFSALAFLPETVFL